MNRRLLPNVTCVAIAGRGVMIEGAPGSGKSALALALIDRGAMLVGDDGIWLERRGEWLWALPPPRIAGRIEIRGVGIAALPAIAAPLCLVLTLGTQGERLPEIARIALDGVVLPRLPLAAQNTGALQAEWALRLHGLPLPGDGA